MEANGTDREAQIHRWVLWGVLCVSIIVVVSLRWFSDHGISAVDWMAVVVAIIAVAGYAIWTWIHRSNLPIELDQAGDNAYYIGLILTFASLAVALLKLVSLMGNGQAEPAQRIAQLIPDFGVALASTIAGILGRLALQQQRLSLADASEIAKKDLDAAIRDFGRKLRLASGQISEATISVRFGLAGKLEEAAKAQVESFDRAQSIVCDAAEAMASRTHELAINVLNANKAVSKEFSRISDSLSGVEIERLNSDIRNVNNSMTDLCDVSVETATQLTSVTQVLQVFSNRLAELVPEDDIARMNALAERTVQRQKRVVQALQSAEEQMRTNGDALQNTSEHITRLRSATDRATQATSAVEKTLSTVKSDALPQMVKSIGKDAQALRDDTHNVRQHAETAVRAMQQLSEHGATSEILKSDFSRTRGKLDEFKLQMDHITKTTDEVSNLIEDTETNLRHFNLSLVDRRSRVDGRWYRILKFFGFRNRS